MLSKNTTETFEIAKIFLKEILTPVVEQSSLRGKRIKKEQKSALVVCISGDLGAGKTAFTKAVAKHLGIKHTVNSPTFVIMKKYPLPKQAWYGTGPLKNLQYKFLFHVDAYRLKNGKELLHLGWEEVIGDKDNLVFIEWPENVKKIIPANAKFVHISTDENGHRNFKIK